MSSRIALITIMLAYCSVHTCRAAAVTWADHTCPISIPESKLKANLHEFAATGGANYYTILTQNVNGRFTIASNGTLSSATELDYESDEKSYSVQIMATTSNKSVNANLTCVIQVTDVNDEPPLFIKKSYSVDTVNNVAIDTSVLTVSAIDRDVSKTFNTVVYSIKVGENSVNFTINVDTGVIRAKTVLAAADPLNLTITVVATDNTKDAFIDEASVRVCVGCKTSGSSSPVISLFASVALFFSVVLM